MAIRNPQSTIRDQDGAGPAWARALAELVEFVAGAGAMGGSDRSAGPDRFINPQAPLPFEEILAPLVRYAAGRLRRECSAACSWISQDAHARLERFLLGRLAHLAKRTLYLEFALYRMQRESSWQRLYRLAGQAPPRDLYRAFTAHVLTGGLVSLLEEYAVLGRLIATLVDLWVEAAGEFLRRLAADMPEIRRTFAGGEDTGEAVDLAVPLSDPHRGGRTVIAVTFASGLKLIYKPRPVAAEGAFFDLLGWLNDHLPGAPSRTLRILDRRTHGWVEFVEHSFCQDAAAARRYYRRAGVLLCLLYALRATDLHRGNLIACGEHLVLVDLETILHPDLRMQPRGDTGTAASRMAHRQMRHSVLGTGFLPSWLVHRGGAMVFDLSGLAGFGGQETPQNRLTWQSINTDGMAPAFEQVRVRPEQNVAVGEPAAFAPGEHVDDLIAGFQETYRLLMARREELLGPGGVLEHFADRQVRLVFRATWSYYQLLESLTDPDLLRNGVQWWARLDSLDRVLDSTGHAPHLERMVAAERAAMARFDIPLFRASATGRDLMLDDGGIAAEALEAPGLQGARDCLAALSQEDLRRQVSYIHGSLYARTARGLHGEKGTFYFSASEKLNVPFPPPAPAELVGAALRIAEEMRAHAVLADDGSCTWVAPQWLPAGDRFQLKPIGYSLYDGAAGIALFLAAAEGAERNGRFKDLAMGVLGPLRQELKAPGGALRLCQALGIGGAAGLGSIIYGLVTAGELLAEPELLAAAQAAAEGITPEAIAADARLDVVAGAAGAILGLLALHEATGDAGVLARCVTCGKHLLDRRTGGGPTVPSGPGLRAWPNPSGHPPLTGFSHGAAGIAYALLRLHAATGRRSLRGDAAFRDAAAEAIAYEDSVYSPQAANWPDFRHVPPSGRGPDAQPGPVGTVPEGDADQPTFMTTWCHGAAGIGLGRLGGLAVLDTPTVRRDIDRAIEATRRAGLRDADHLCCGNLGRAETLLTAARVLSQPELARQARQWAGAVLARFGHEGRFALSAALPPDVFHPGLFQGLAGIGYELLRLARPEALPCVLLWE